MGEVVEDSGIDCEVWNGVEIKQPESLNSEESLKQSVVENKINSNENKETNSFDKSDFVENTKIRKLSELARKIGLSYIF